MGSIRISTTGGSGSCTTLYGCISEPQYYSGTLISNRYIVTAAEIFDDDK